MKAKRKIAVALATVAVMGCLALPSMAYALPTSDTGYSTTYYGSSLCYRGWVTFSSIGTSRVGVGLATSKGITGVKNTTISNGKHKAYSGYIDTKLGSCYGTVAYY